VRPRAPVRPAHPTPPEGPRATLSHAPRREDHAPPRRLQTSRERLPREQARAPRPLQALAQALQERGRPATRVVEVEGRLQAGGQRLGNICGVMCLTVGGCRTTDELTRGCCWDKHGPGQILGALPQPTWGRPWPRRAQELRAPWWPPVQDQSPAPRSRWPWTWGGDDSRCKTAGPPLGLVGTWGSGQEHGGRRGIDGLRLVVVSGDGTRVMPVACTVRRPDPVGPGRPGRAPRTWWPVRRDRTGAAIRRRCRPRPPPRGVADGWVGDAKPRAQGAIQQPGSVVVEGQHTDVFPRPDGRRMTAQELRRRADWPWRDGLPRPRRRSGRLTATSPTSGPVTGVVSDEPRPARSDLRGRATRLTAPRVLRAWNRRSGIAPHGRVLTPLVAVEACQVQGADASDGPLVVRLRAGLALR
jgi:hypothetical protein